MQKYIQKCAPSSVIKHEDGWFAYWDGQKTVHPEFTNIYYRKFLMKKLSPKSKFKQHAHIA